MKKILLSVLLTTMSAPLIAESNLEGYDDLLKSIVKGEFRHLATDQERFNYLRYEELRWIELTDHKGYFSDLTTCQILAGKENYLLSEFAVMREERPELYRDFSYCYYLQYVGSGAHNVEQVKRWVEANESKVDFNYSYEERIEHYMSLNKFSDWDCKNFRSYIIEFEKASGQDHANIWNSYRASCR